MSNVKLSIRLMTYNHADFIEDALKGIDQQQTNFDFEVVIGDDFSSDNTLQLVKDYPFTNSNITVNILERKRGDAYDKERQIRGRLYNFINIIDNCQGKYIALLDGDDYWTDPLKLQKQVDFLESNSEYNLVFHPCNFLKNKNLIKQEFDKIDYHYNLYNLLTKWGIPTASMMCKNFNTEDVPLWYYDIASGDIGLAMLLFEKGKFKLLQDYMSVYRVEGQGVSVLHKGYRMIHYRAKFYSNLNEYFDYKYEKEIYDALAFLYNKFSKAQQPKKSQKMEEVSIRTHLQLVLKKIKQKLL